MARPRKSTTWRAIHGHLYADRGPAWKQKCECGLPAEEWAYQYNGSPELISPDGAKYSTDIWNCYKAMCVWCHKALDYKMDPDRYSIRRQKARDRIIAMNKTRWL
jgi:hypothetical protein